jgi:predicted P-loop ATPase
MDGNFPDLTEAKAMVTMPRKRQGSGWLAGCQTDSNAEPRPNLYNVMLAMRDDPRIRDLFAYDEMLRATVLQKPVPGRVLDSAAADTFQSRPVKDPDVSLVQELLQGSGLEKIGSEVVHQAVDLRGRKRSFHPVRDYLGSLQWDRTPRVDTWLTTYLGAINNEYHRGIGHVPGNDGRAHLRARVQGRLHAGI